MCLQKGGNRKDCLVQAFNLTGEATEPQERKEAHPALNHHPCMLGCWAWEWRRKISLEVASKENMSGAWWSVEMSEAKEEEESETHSALGQLYIESQL